MVYVGVLNGRAKLQNEWSALATSYRKIYPIHKLVIYNLYNVKNDCISYTLILKKYSNPLN